MRFILYYHEDTGVLGKNFETSISLNFFGTDIEIFKTFDRLKRRMKKHTDFFQDEVYVILVDSKSRLLELLLFSHLMEDKDLILVLPDGSEETTRLALHLYPRFITRISDDYKDLCLVLQHMSSRNSDKKKKAPDSKNAAIS